MRERDGTRKRVGIRKWWNEGSNKHEKQIKHIVKAERCSTRIAAWYFV
jgi:hypothetical protein